MVALALPLLLAAAAVALAQLGGPGPGRDGGQPAPLTDPSPTLPASSLFTLPLPAVPAPDAGSPACASLLASLPDRLPSAGTELLRRPLADPAPSGAAAWGEDSPVVLRCGLPRPAGLTPTSSLLEVDGVRWLPPDGRTGLGQTGGTAATDQATTSSWVACDRPVYIALTLPPGSGTGPLQMLSAVIGSTLATRVVIPAP
jgi:hypothetical protein